MNDEEKQKFFLAAMVMVDNAKVLMAHSEVVQQTGYHEITPELWNEIRDAQPRLRQFLQGIVDGATAAPIMSEQDELMEELKARAAASRKERGLS